jgi:hypothetical protein
LTHASCYKSLIPDTNLPEEPEKLSSILEEIIELSFSVFQASFIVKIQRLSFHAFKK